MIVNNLFVYGDEFMNFFWIDSQTGKPLSVYESLSLATDEQGIPFSRKIVLQILLPSNFFKVVNFEMDPEGSQLILLPISSPDKKVYEVIILQEDSNEIMKVLTPVSEKLKNLHEIETDIMNRPIMDYPKFINHPSINLKHVSETGIKNIYKNFYQINDYILPSADKLIEMFTSQRNMSAQMTAEALGNSEYKEKIQFSRALHKNYDNPTVFLLSEEKLKDKKYKDSDILNWLQKF